MNNVPGAFPLVTPQNYRKNMKWNFVLEKIKGNCKRKKWTITQRDTKKAQSYTEKFLVLFSKSYNKPNPLWSFVKLLCGTLWYSQGKNVITHY